MKRSARFRDGVATIARARWAGPRPLVLTPFARIGLALLLIVAAIVGSGPASVTPTAAAGPPPDHSTANPLHPYVVQLGSPNAVILANAPVAELTQRAQQQDRDELAAVLEKLRAAGQAGPATFDESSGSFRVNLSDTATRQISINPLVASVAPPASAPPATAANPRKAAPPIATPGHSAPLVPSTACQPVSDQVVSSVDFVQVYSPFMWGHASIGGLSVQLTLLDSTGTVTVGVPVQSIASPPNNYVQIDRTQLYYETVFVDPNNPSHPSVIIQPGEVVHVVTSGVDPTTNQQECEDKLITVDNVQAWTSDENGTVWGNTSLVNAPVVVTVSTGSVSVQNYLTPGSGLTYANLTADSNGNFTATAFQTSSNPTLSPVKFTQGTTGFVRVQHPNGDEVYTVHGQNVLPLEDSNVLHGWAYPLPGSLPSLDSGVAVTHPLPSVTVTLSSAQGVLEDTETVNGGAPYSVFFKVTIIGGDIIRVSINQGPVNQISTVPLKSSINLTANDITGVGPANTEIVGGAGLIDGYISSFSTFTFLPLLLTTDGGGNFNSGTIACGTNGTLSLQPGSFGYVGYEDAHGNFIYLDFAAPRTDVMVNFPFAEGWVADATYQATIIDRDANSNVKFQTSLTQQLLWMTTQKLYLDVYDNLVPTAAMQFFTPGDTVGVTENGQAWTIPVDALTSYENMDAAAVEGEAPLGGTTKAIPANDRTAFQQAVASSTSAVASPDGSYTAGNPFQRFSDSTCSTSSTTEAFSLGEAGRTYLPHPDGSQVFTAWGSTMNVNENENVVDLYIFPEDSLDWPVFKPQVPLTATVTLTPLNGLPTTVQVPSVTANARTEVKIVDAQNQPVLIRAGDSISTTYLQGPSVGPTQTATFGMNILPLIIGSPDLSTSTLAGIGPNNWNGLATLNLFNATTMIPVRAYTAFGPFQFTSGTSPIPLAQGYSGYVSFGDVHGNSVWSAWAATAIPIKITTVPLAGQTVVCGIAPANNTVNIHDVSIQPNNVIIGTGSANGSGNFCVTVSPLYKGQVLLAETGGTYSQPVIVGIAASGVGSYLAGNSATSKFNLPIVRTDASYDTVIHLANATAGATTATITFYNPDGSVNLAVPIGLAPWTTDDYDAVQFLGTAFDGSATVVASPSAVTVSADVVDGDQASDNVDSYAGVAGSSTTTWLPLATNGNPAATTLHLQHPGANPATATVTFYQNGAPLATTPTSWPLAANGSAAVNLSSVGGLPAGWSGSVEVQGTQPLAVGAELAGNGVFATVTAATAPPATTFDVPRFAYGVANPTLPADVENSTIVLLDAAATPATFTVTFYDSTGAVVKQVTSPPVSPNATWSLGLALGGADPGLAPDAAYSAVATSSVGAAALVAKAVGSTTAPGGLTTYTPASGPLPGTWSSVPGLRKTTSAEQSTDLTLMNNRTVAETYQIAYSNQNGTEAETNQVCLGANAAWYYSQATDAGLPGGFDGGAQIVNESYQVLPIVVAELYAGSFGPPPSAPASGTCGVTVQPTNTPTGWTGQPTSTPTGSVGQPTSTPTGSSMTRRVFLPVIPNSASGG